MDGNEHRKDVALPEWVGELGTLRDDEEADLARLGMFFEHLRRAEARLDEPAQERIWALLSTAVSLPQLQGAGLSADDAITCEGA